MDPYQFANSLCKNANKYLQEHLGCDSESKSKSKESDSDHIKSIKSKNKDVDGIIENAIK